MKGHLLFLYLVYSTHLRLGMRNYVVRDVVRTRWTCLSFTFFYQSTEIEARKVNSAAGEYRRSCGREGEETFLSPSRSPFSCPFPCSRDLDKSTYAVAKSGILRSVKEQRRTRKVSNIQLRPKDDDGIEILQTDY